MTVRQLIEALKAQIAKDEFLADANVTFGQDFTSVEGGIVGKDTKRGLVVLNLAPMSLDKMRGF